MVKVNNDYRVWLVGQVYDCGVHNDARTVWKLGLRSIVNDLTLMMILSEHGARSD